MIKFKIFIVFIVFIVFVCFGSCSPEKDRKNEMIIGTWIIEEIKYLEEDYMGALAYNFISFENNDIKDRVKIPKTNSSEALNSHWKLVYRNDKYYLLINSKNQVFDGEYEFSFFEDRKRKVLGIFLKSNELEIKAVKI